MLMYIVCEVEWLVHCHIASNSGSPGVLISAYTSVLHTVLSDIIPQHRPCIWLHSESCCVNIVGVINKQPHTERARWRYECFFNLPLLTVIIMSLSLHPKTSPGNRERGRERREGERGGKERKKMRERERGGRERGEREGERESSS